MFSDLLPGMAGNWWGFVKASPFSRKMEVHGQHGAGTIYGGRESDGQRLEWRNAYSVPEMKESGRRAC